MICGLSGGVDSSVAAALVQQAVGDQLTCVFVDHGLLRAGEAEQVEKDFVAATGVDLVVVDAREQFLTALAGVTDPEEKRKIIGREFIRVFEQAARDVVGSTRAPTASRSSSSCRARSTPTSSSPAAAPAPRTSSRHHNVGGLPDDLQFELVEPLRHAVQGRGARRSASSSGVPEAIVWRQPFPGPGARHPDRRRGHRRAARRCCARPTRSPARSSPRPASTARSGSARSCCSADVRSVGVQGDGRTYGHPVVLRPVSSEDAMTADWTRVPYDVLARISTRITNEVREVNRVVLDVTSKPPGTIEWE